MIFKSRYWNCGWANDITHGIHSVRESNESGVECVCVCGEGGGGILWCKYWLKDSGIKVEVSKWSVQHYVEKCPTSGTTNALAVFQTYFKCILTTGKSRRYDLWAVWGILHNKFKKLLLRFTFKIAMYVKDRVLCLIQSLSGSQCRYSRASVTYFEGFYLSPNHDSSSYSCVPGLLKFIDLFCRQIPEWSVAVL